jgi:hypothetical protein
MNLVATGKYSCRPWARVVDVDHVMIRHDRAVTPKQADDWLRAALYAHGESKGIEGWATAIVP